RPRPVAPPVTITTLPCHPFVTGWARGSSSTVPLVSGASNSHDGRWPNPKDGKGIDWLRYGAAKGAARRGLGGEVARWLGGEVAGGLGGSVAGWLGGSVARWLGGSCRWRFGLLDTA